MACTVSIPWKAMSWGANHTAPFTSTVSTNPTPMIQMFSRSCSAYSTIVISCWPRSARGRPIATITAKIARFARSSTAPRFTSARRLRRNPRKRSPAPTRSP